MLTGIGWALWDFLTEMSQAEKSLDGLKELTESQLKLRKNETNVRCAGSK